MNKKMNKFRKWIIEKLGGVPKEYANIPIISMPAIRQDKICFEKLGVTRIFNTDEWARICKQSDYLELVKREMLGRFVDKLLEEQDKFIHWRITEGAIIPKDAIISNSSPHFLNDDDEPVMIGTRLDAHIKVGYTVPQVKTSLTDLTEWKKENATISFCMDNGGIEK